ncbi:MAG: LytR/AlgR family response regulator transcription factor [Eubacteriaceae bacterium]|jgi:two-component system LytT family response regulator
MHVVYVDDEQTALENFRLTVADFSDIESLHLFSDSGSALDWVQHHPVHAAFLDMEMPGMNGIILARRMKEINPDIQIVFVTAYSEYALEAFDAGAIGYILKPYFRSDIRKELNKMECYRPKTSNLVKIRTIPVFSVSYSGKTLHLGRRKTVELLALLVDRGERGITTQEGISCLWPERPGDSKTQSLFRMTYKRLADSLTQEGIGHIIAVQGNRRFIREQAVDCDLYKILSGDGNSIRQYAGEYLSEYSWAEERNAQLYRIWSKTAY